MSERFGEIEIDLTPEEKAAWLAKFGPKAQVQAPVVEVPAASPALPLPAPAAAVALAAAAVVVAPAKEVPAAFRPLVGEYRTAHGVKGSDRMHRFYRWCKDAGIGLSDWSTDTQVKAVYPLLQAALVSETARLGTLEVGSVEGVVQAELIRDIEGIMQRVPENRVASQTAQQHKVEEQKKFRDGLIAVENKSDVTGGVVYWQLTGEVDRATLVAKLIEQGLEESDAPALATPEVALGRAAKELQGRSVLIRKMKAAGGWAVVHETEVNAELVTQQILRVYLQGEKDNEEVKYVPTSGHEEQAAIEFNRIIAEYNKVRAALSVVDLSSWLVKLASKLDGVPLRDRGGIYFIPRANIETLRKVKAALSGAKAGCIVYEIPAMHSSEAITAIYDAVASEAAQYINDIECELNAGDGIGARAAKNRVKEVEQFLSKVRNYEGLLGQKFTAPAEKLAELVKKLNKATTRAAQLEID